MQWFSFKDKVKFGIKNKEKIRKALNIAYVEVILV